MLDWLPADSLSQGNSLVVLVARLGAAIGCGLVVAMIYRATRGPSRAAVSFPGTLVMLCVLISLVTQVIGGNVAMAFSLVGALSIVRFRTVVQDTMDTAFVIFAVIVGMAIGAGQLPVALGGTLATGLVSWLFRDRVEHTARRDRRQFDVCVRLDPDMAAEPEVRAALARHDPAVRCIAARTTKKRTAVRVVYGLHLPGSVSPAVLAGQLTDVGGVQGVEVARTRPSG